MVGEISLKKISEQSEPLVDRGRERDSFPILSPYLPTARFARRFFCIISSTTELVHRLHCFVITGK